MKQHLDSQAHSTAIEFYNKLKDDGKSAETAAKRTIEWATEKQQASAISFARQAGREHDERVKHMRSEVALLCWAAERGISFNAICESNMFKAYTDVYGMRAPPGRARMDDVLTAACNLMQRHQDEWMSQVDFFSITADAATLKYDAATRYVALTMHAITPDFKQRRAVLGLITLNKSHNWRHLTAAVTNRIENRLPANAVLVATTTDHGSNFKKMAAALHTNLDQAAIEGLGPDSFDEPPANAADNGLLDITAAFDCAAHAMHNAALDLYKDAGFTDTLDKVRAMVTYVRASPALCDAFESAQLDRLRRQHPGDAAKHHPRKLVLDVKTRWLYMHEMLEAFVSCIDDLLTMALAGHFDKFDGHFITLSEIAVIRDMTRVLAPAAKFVNDVEGEKYVTIALIPVLLKQCFDAMRIDMINDSSEVQHLKRNFNKRMDERLGYILKKPNLALAAAALHPAFGHLSFVSPQTRDAVWRDLATWCTEFPAVSHVSAGAAGQAAGPGIPQLVRPRLEDYTRELAAVRAEFEKFTPATPTIIRTPAKDGDVFDPLFYWKKAHDAGFQRISHLARIVFAVPGSSAPSERVFSLANMIVTQLRANLLDYKVEQLVMLRHHIADVGANDFVTFCAAELARAEVELRKRKSSNAPASQPPRSQPPTEPDGDKDKNE